MSTFARDLLRFISEPLLVLGAFGIGAMGHSIAGAIRKGDLREADVLVVVALCAYLAIRAVAIFVFSVRNRTLKFSTFKTTILVFIPMILSCVFLYALAQSWTAGPIGRNSNWLLTVVLSTIFIAFALFEKTVHYIFGVSGMEKNSIPNAQNIAFCLALAFGYFCHLLKPIGT